jgi:isopentenyl diphosphate isomerase/L-lactate dehydrogenase-like FMN-dependent dehydrogenase
MAHPRLPSTLPEFTVAAASALALEAFDYITGGAGDEWTLAENVEAWQRLSIVPRMLTGAAEVDTSVMVLGAPLTHPIIAAPMAYQRVATPDGELAMARAAAATSTALCLSTLTNFAAPDVAAAAPDARRWYQVYVFKDRALTNDLIESALGSGFEALVITVDFPVAGIRERDLRSGFRVRDVVPAAAAAGVQGTFEPHQTTEQLVDPTLSWSDIGNLAARYGVPVLVKGILSPDDAVTALEHGAAGVVVSNHGGRQLDGVVATATILPEIVDAMGGRGEVIVDGGIRRGTDVLRALALGAGAVMVGRPLFWGLAAGGAPGAQRVLELFIKEFRNALVLSGAISARAVHRGHLHTSAHAAEAAGRAHA